jgi:GNAT superfamily N-acetyltransferase
MHEVAATEPFSVAELTVYLNDGRIWVATRDGAPVGYALVDIIDGLAHLEQISVGPSNSRQGYGAALLAQVYEWTREHRLAAVTLTTFEHVSWNAPYYSRHGFRVLDDDEIGPELRRLREHEAREGLDPALRVCMRRDMFASE